MSCRYKLTSERNMMSDNFNHHIEQHDKLLQDWRKSSQKQRRNVNKYYHLSSYHSKLWNEWFDMEDDSPEKPIIKRKLDKIGHLMAKTMRENELLSFDAHINQCITDIHFKGFNKYLDKLQKLHFLTKKRCHIVKLPRCKIQQLEKEDCCICLSPHKIKDIVTTSCSHSFGKSCAENLLDKNYYDGCDITCPMCRNPDMTFTLYR